LTVKDGIRYLSEDDKNCATKDKDAATYTQITCQYADFCMHNLSVELQTNNQQLFSKLTTLFTSSMNKLLGEAHFHNRYM
jgi:hypothetical protein